MCGKLLDGTVRIPYEAPIPTVATFDNSLTNDLWRKIIHIPQSFDDGVTNITVINFLRLYFHLQLMN